MNKQMYWGIAALIIVLIAAGGFMYWQWSSVQQLKEQIAQDDKLLEGKDKEQHAVSKADEKPPDEPGYKWVRHNDHWDKVPVSAPNTWSTEMPKPVIESAKDMDPYIVRLSPTVRRIGGVLFDENDTIIIDRSFLDNPYQAIADIGEVILNRDNYTIQQFDEAVQKDDILSSKILDGYYGKGSYGDKYEYMDVLLKLQRETYGKALLDMFGIDEEAITDAVKSGQPYAIPKPQLPKDMPLPGEDSK